VKSGFEDFHLAPEYEALEKIQPILMLFSHGSSPDSNLASSLIRIQRFSRDSPAFLL
jgi:hypothetical protein